MLNIDKTITVKTNLVGGHDYLDYKSEYKFYLEVIHHYFYGYISIYHFEKIFEGMADKRYLTHIAKEFVVNKWMGSVAISNYKILYLKRKSTICLSENVNNGDLNLPTIRQITRSLMLAEIHLNYLVMPSIYKRLNNDIYILSKIGRAHV